MALNWFGDSSDSSDEDIVDCRRSFQPHISSPLNSLALNFGACQIGGTSNRTSHLNITTERYVGSFRSSSRGGVFQTGEIVFSNLCMGTNEREQQKCCSDGMSSAPFAVRLSDTYQSRQWCPRRVAENQPLPVKLANSPPEIYAWQVIGSTEYFVFGFEDLSESGTYYYATIRDNGSVRLSSNFDEPHLISEVDEDPRVMQYFRSSHTGQYYLRSSRNKDMYVNVIDDYIKAEESEPLFATPWSLESLS